MYYNEAFLYKFKKKTMFSHSRVMMWNDHLMASVLKGNIFIDLHHYRGIVAEEQDYVTCFNDYG